MTDRRVLGPRMADRAQPGVAGQPEDVAAALIFQELHYIRRVVMAIATHAHRVRFDRVER